MVKRVVVGAHYGLRDWLVQRVSAVVMAVYTVLLAVVLVAAPPLDYAGWRALFAQQWMRFATLLFFLSLFLHAWVGMRDILMDYVHPTGLRLALQVAVVLSLVFYAVWTVQVLWSV
ncbi:succinate dehydrogenase, hydrophobic membrane anchor protein [Pelomicrobium sp. G1]|uniref:succinate dehydrogenase, hydrophobic membrane anchor protein n=1 Tax=unclassified Pelomicrobium TaxID=2815318 RepID=UPI0021DC9D48|nr:MAG: succinate dehydrogenase, hydrophobic membrane anchor protein [Burkholderiales bacterium]